MISEFEKVHEVSKQDGLKLSPVDLHIENSVSINLTPLKWVNYNVPAKKMKVTNSGFTAILSGKWNQERPFICNGPLNGKYVFSQVHFHWGENNHTGSEHAVEGMRYPLEMHVVHFKSEYMSQDVALKKKDGVTIMVHLFAVQEERNIEMDRLTDVLQYVQKANSSAKLCSSPLPEIVCPFDSDYFLYWGSVSSAVGLHQILWFVSRRVLPISPHQLEQFRSLHNMQKQPLLRNYSDPCDLKGRTLFLISPSTISTTVYGMSHIWGKTIQQKRQKLDDKTDVNLYAEYKSLTGIKVDNNDTDVNTVLQRSRVSNFDIDTDLQKIKDHAIPTYSLGKEINIPNYTNRIFQVYTQAPVHYLKNPLSEVNSKYVKNNNHIYNSNAWQNDDTVFPSHKKSTLKKKKVRITENDTSIEELCYDLNSNFPADFSVENSLYEESVSFSSQYESTPSYTYEEIERSFESHSDSYSIPSSFNREYRFTTGDISFNMYGPSRKIQQRPIFSRQRETIFDTDTSVEETCITLSREPPSEPNTPQLHLLPNRFSPNCLCKKPKKIYLPPLPDTTGSIELNIVRNDASLIKTDSPQNQSIHKTTVNKTLEIPIQLSNNPILNNDKTKLLDKLHAFNDSEKFPNSLLVNNGEMETAPKYRSKREYQYSDSTYECEEYIDSMGMTVRTHKHTNIENWQFTETLITEQSRPPEVVKEIIVLNVPAETKKPLKCGPQCECEKKGIIRPEEVKEPSVIYMDKFLKNKDLKTKFKTGILRLNPEVKIHISEEKLKSLPEPTVNELKKMPLYERKNQQPQTDSSSSNVNSTNKEPEKVLGMALTTSMTELYGDFVSYEATSESLNAYPGSVQNSDDTDDLNEENGGEEDKDSDPYNNSENDLSSGAVVELQKTDTMPQKKTRRYSVQQENEPFNQISNITPLSPANLKSDIKRIIKNMKDISGNELRAYENLVEIEESVSKIKAYSCKNDFNKPKQITETSRISEEGYELKLVKPAEDLSVHDVLLQEKQKKIMPDKSMRTAASKQEVQLLSTKPVKSLKSQKNKQQVFKSDPIRKKSPEEKIKAHMSRIKRDEIDGNRPIVMLKKQKTDISHSLKRGITKLSDPSTVHVTGHVKKQKTLSTHDLKTKYLPTREKKGANDMNVAEHQHCHFSHKQYRKEIYKSKTETNDSIKHLGIHGVKQRSGMPNLKKLPGIMSTKANVSNLHAEHAMKNNEISPFERVIISVPHPPKYLETPVFDVTKQQQPLKEREFTQAVVGAEILPVGVPSQQSMIETIVHLPEHPFSDDLPLSLSIKQTPCLCNITDRQSNKIDATTSIEQLTTDAGKMKTSIDHQSVLEPQIYFTPTTQLDIPIYDDGHSKPTVVHIELNEPKVCIMNRRSATELSPIQLQCRPILSRALHQLTFPQEYATKSQLAQRNELISKHTEESKAAEKPIMKDLIDKRNKEMPDNEQQKLKPRIEDKQMYTNYLNSVETKMGLSGNPYEANTNKCDCQCLIKSLDGKKHKLMSPVPVENKLIQTNYLNEIGTEKDLISKSNDKTLNSEQLELMPHSTKENKQNCTSNLDGVGTNTDFVDKLYDASAPNQCQCTGKSLDNEQHELMPHAQKKVKQMQTDYLSSPAAKKDLNNKSNEDIPHDKQQKIVPSDPEEIKLILSSKYKPITSQHTTKHEETKTETVSKCDMIRTEELRDNQILKKEIISKHDTTKTEVKSKKENIEIVSRSVLGAEEDLAFLSRFKQPLTDTTMKKGVEKSNITVDHGSKMYTTDEGRGPSSKYDRILKQPLTDKTMKEEVEKSNIGNDKSHAPVSQYGTKKFLETNMRSVDLRKPGALRQQLINDKLTTLNEVHIGQGTVSPDKHGSIIEDAKNVLDSICTKAEDVADNKKQNLITINKEEQNRLVTTRPHSQVKVISEDVANTDDGDAVVIYIRQAKTSTTHVQPLITVDLSKRKQLSSSEIAIQSINFTEIDPESEGVIRRQSVAFRNNELQKTDVKFASTDPVFKYWPKKPLEKFYGFQSPIQIHKTSVPRLDLPKLLFFGHWTCQGLALIENIGTTGTSLVLLFTNTPKLNNNTEEVPIIQKSGVHRIQCEECEMVYIGETGRAMECCLKEHRRGENDRNTSTIYARYFMDKKHTFDDCFKRVRLNFELESPGSKPFLRGGPLNDDYEFDHLHFHWAKPDYRGTEHLIGDDGGCAEAHFVYFKKSYRTFREALQRCDGITMIAIRLKQGGNTSPALERLIRYVEQVQEFDTYVSIEPCDMFLWIRPLVTSTTRGYYIFPGSFTMEPFKEVVTWILYVDSITICCQEMAAFHQLLNSNGQPIVNCRELQMIKNRPIYRVY